jgi:hypothetical protein
MKFPFNKFTNNLVFFLILSFIIIIFYFFFFRYKEGAWGSSSKSNLVEQSLKQVEQSLKQVEQTQSTNRNSSSTSTNPTYSVQTYSSTPTIVPPACNLMTYEQCAENSGFCMWDSLTSGCLNKLDCTNLNQTTCSKQNYCTWNSSINKCSVKT